MFISSAKLCLIIYPISFDTPPIPDTSKQYPNSSMLEQSEIDRRCVAYPKAGNTSVNFNSLHQKLHRELYNIPRNRARLIILGNSEIRFSSCFRQSLYLSLSSREKARPGEPGDLKNRRSRKRRMRNELSSALRRFPLCIIHDRVRASGPVNYVLRRESFANSSRLALRRQCKETRERGERGERREASRRRESSDAEEATADFHRVIEGIEASRRVVLLEPAATIINGQGVTPREITSLTLGFHARTKPANQPPAGCSNSV